MSRNNKLGKNQEHKRAGRIIAFQALYSYDIEKNNIDDLLKFDLENESNIDGSGYARTILNGAITHLDEIDLLIKSKLVRWDFERLSLIDKAVLRFATYELLYSDVPDIIVINEAVEIAKQFGNEDSYKFINGILDAINKKNQDIKIS